MREATNVYGLCEYYNIGHPTTRNLWCYDIPAIFLSINNCGENPDGAYAATMLTVAANNYSTVVDILQRWQCLGSKTS